MFCSLTNSQSMINFDDFPNTSLNVVIKILNRSELAFAYNGTKINTLNIIFFILILHF